ncbi:hypothetical protein D3C76_1844820 [compost metagenome]
MAVLAVIFDLIPEFFRNQHLAQAQAVVVLIIELTLLVDFAIEVDVGGAPGLVAQAHAGAEGFGVT